MGTGRRPLRHQHRRLIMNKLLTIICFTIWIGSILLLSYALTADPHPALHVVTLIRVGLICICVGQIDRALR